MANEKSMEAGARQRALYYLSLKERSEHEVEAYLTRKGYDGDTATSVAASLRTGGLVDDARLADIIIRAAPGRGWGPARVRQELKRRGIGRDTADEAMQQYLSEGEDIETALALGRKNWLAGRGEERNRRARLSNHLKRRGFSTGTIIKVLDQLYSEAAGDDSFP